MSTLSSDSSVYTELLLQTERHIRLIRLLPGIEDDDIHLELSTSDLDSKPTYETLSYTWGDVSDPKSVHIRGLASDAPVSFAVTSNCYRALARLRLKQQARTIWVDAISINQNDVEERNSQVALMSRIYSEAANVVVYLGERTSNSDLALDFITECDNPSPDASSLSYPKEDELVKSLVDFFHRPWFSRVWVIQEIALPNSAIVHCGKRTIDWAAIQNFQRWNVNAKWLAELPFVLSMPKRSLELDEPEHAMLNALLKSRHCAATDPRDKVYALLPLLRKFNKRIELQPRYQDTATEVFTDCAKTLIATCGWDILHAVQGGSKLPDLPSWVPDWSVPPRREFIGNCGKEGMERGYYTHFWDRKRDFNVPYMPELVSKTLQSKPEKTSQMLRVHGFSCGKIAKIGSTYIASKTPFPYHEWRNMLDDETVKAIDRAEPAPAYRGDQDHLDYTFHWVLGAIERGVYPNALRMFLFPRKPGKSTRFEDISRWEEELRELASNKGVKDDDGVPELPFHEIPFHLAADDFPPSYFRYIQAVLRHCHSRRFFITEKGYIGIAPQEAEIGDDVYICAGAVTPFVLRDHGTVADDHGGNWCFNLVGECYKERSPWESIRYGLGDPEAIYIA
ncbi:HET-domain-containing protein [Aaosphaeria arxii CBS 175.79]|uniref:HET-domain-containing protein n=1 Tax=Aaosphaeria arxii CBS 175.79 TaxID=1450172 RepID=A0A6A5XEC0_9PLEO|nr:HET-domain-containing protein [Aaosphaeria arxii CBS 175.79]KAF2011402.1 HET-domain-containing protein [Aaosphaeria arxii CBS 175.79]